MKKGRKVKSKLPNSERSILHLAVSLCETLDQIGVLYCVIGGVAYQRWGEPRQTVDVDVTVFVGFGYEKSFMEKLLLRYDSRIESPLTFALENRILLLRDSSGTGIDVSLGGLPFERRVMERSSHWEVKKHGRIRTCGAEDLVVLKAFASRPQDWIDIEKVIIRQDIVLDRDLIRTELAPLVALKEEPEINKQLESLFQKHELKGNP